MIKSLWDFARPILWKTLKYGITIALTSLGFSSLQSCYTPIDCEKVYISPSVSLSDTIDISPIISIDGRDSVVHQYDSVSNKIITDACSFLKAISNKILK